MTCAVPLGVVAIGRNEGERLKRCLNSVPPDVPIIYVDSGSSDDSVNSATLRGAEVIRLDLALPFTAARARNEGFFRLMKLWPNVRYVQFVDGDCEIEQGWLEHAVEFLEAHPGVAAACGRRRELDPSASFYNTMFDEEWNTPIGPAAACGGDAMMRVRAMDEVGGYDPGMMAGEEPELCARLRSSGWSIWRLDAPMTIHDAAMHRFGQWWRRALRSGYGYAQVWEKTRRGSTDTLYGRELVRAVLWSAGVCLLSMAAALIVGGAGLLLPPVIWGAQFFRLSRDYGMKKSAHLLIAKAAEFLGATRFLLDFSLKRRQLGIFYK